MNKKNISRISKSLIKAGQQLPSDKKFKFSFDSQHLHYQSYLQSFSSDHYLLLDELYEELAVDKSIDRLFSGDFVNASEERPALHHKYRSSSSEFEFNFKKITQKLSTKINNGKYDNIITFGIGGSYEGPKLLQELCFTPSSTYKYFFVSGPDKDEFNAVVKPLLGQKNFYIFASKSLATDETLSCLHWLGSNRNAQNSLAITSNLNAALKLGFPNSSIALFPESVGGRYSIWSPISLSASLENNFSSFLKGGSQADSLLFSKSTEAKKYKKLLKTLAFSDLWFSNYRKKCNRVVLSYNWRLRSFANYIQQLEMESLGKPMTPSSIFTETGQTIFGGFGSTAQHSYFQLLHQGTSNFSADILYSPRAQSPLSAAQAKGQASLLSSKKQYSKNILEITNSNTPVNLFALKSISLPALGFLLATWEHRVFVNACMLEINPFDQFGVAAGKAAARKFLA